LGRQRAEDTPLSAVVDVGSNSIRLVVFRGERRAPLVLFNEKVMAGLGRGVAADGRIAEDGFDAARAALRRFSLLCTDIGVERIHAVATAAVRDAVNRDRFLAMARNECGMPLKLIAGEEEARLAAYGVIAGIPDADGIVGDLGGGSLELVRVREGRLFEQISLPIGALKLDVARRKSTTELSKLIRKSLGKVDWASKGKRLPFYTVGGSWRALAQLHMHLTDYPLPVVHQYAMDAAAIDRLARALPNLAPKRLRAVPQMSSSRIPYLPGAALLLRATVKKFGSSGVISSSYGLREGLLYGALPKAIRSEDPLVSAAIEEGRLQGRFPQHGDALMRWMDGLFEKDTAEERRLRLVACHLADTAWRAHPDFRAERGLEIALYGNWVAITARQRALLGAALFATYGGRRDSEALGVVAALADAASISRAFSWGLALRVGQRLSAGTMVALKDSRLFIDGSDLVLTLKADHAPLFADTVERRLALLATMLGLKPTFRTS
jgi:exopolyphosphatase/guanosine-5'-triphosphate,3'-diphosphate pyrophosphatase